MLVEIGAAIVIRDSCPGYNDTTPQHHGMAALADKEVMIGAAQLSLGAAIAACSTRRHCMESMGALVFAQAKFPHSWQLAEVCNTGASKGCHGRHAERL